MVSEEAPTGTIIAAGAGVFARVMIHETIGVHLGTGQDMTAENIASNWDQTDTGGQSALGSSMTQSSGLFTFPSTGYWLVIAQLKWQASNSNNSVVYKFFLIYNCI